jgi:Fur family ferric uptake transcriptional regulator
MMAETKFQRNTPQRQAILEELQRGASHPTAVELYESVRRRIPRISLGTVYRNLDLLAEMGKIQKLDLGGGEARFDGRVDAHYHVRCIRCGRVDDVHGVPSRLLIDGPNEAAGYEILGHRLEFVGVCPECREPPERNDVGPPQREANQSESRSSQP